MVGICHVSCIQHHQPIPHRQHRHRSQHRLTRGCVWALPLLLSVAMSITHAEPTVTVHPAEQVSGNLSITTAHDANTDAQTGTKTIPSMAQPNALGNTLASGQQPSTEQLSQANQDLLSRNARLQREVNDLQTQVNVLVNERSGQLFMYGAFTVIISMLVGIFVSWLVFVRRERW